MINNEKAARLLEKFLKRKTSKAETEQVDKWYASYEEKETGLDVGQKTVLRDEMYRAIREGIHHLPSHKRIWRLSVARVIQVAAVVLVSVSTVFFFIRLLSKNNPQSGQSTALVTTKNQGRNIVLSDGTRIALQSFTQLSADDQAGSGPREVELHYGEAFFKVFHDPLRRFIVKLPNDLYTKVLGTSFNINTRQFGNQISITVQTGRIAVGNTHQVLAIMTRGDRIDYDPVRQTAMVSHATLKSKLLRFDRTPLHELVARLGAEYDVQINLPHDKSIQNLQCTGAFENNQDIQEILQDICLLHHLKMASQPDQETFNITKPMGR
jgi:transmembrane sensor